MPSVSSLKEKVGDGSSGVKTRKDCDWKTTSCQDAIKTMKMKGQEHDESLTKDSSETLATWAAGCGGIQPRMLHHV